MRENRAVSWFLPLRWCGGHGVKSLGVQHIQKASKSGTHLLNKTPTELKMSHVFISEEQKRRLSKIAQHWQSHYPQVSSMHINT